MKTMLSPETLVMLHAQGRAKVGQFVNPRTIAACKRVLSERGEDWACSVLFRSHFARRSPVDARWPWLDESEEEILVLADEAEVELLEQELGD